MPMGPAPNMATDLPGPTRPNSLALKAIDRGSSMVPTSKLTSSARGNTCPSAYTPYSANAPEYSVPCVAERLLAVAAEVAGSAGRHRAHGHPLADLVPELGGAAHLDDRAGGLVAFDLGKRRLLDQTEAALQDLDVGAADSGVGDLDLDLVRPRDRFGDVLDLHQLDGLLDGCLHGLGADLGKAGLRYFERRPKKPLGPPDGASSRRCPAMPPGRNTITRMMMTPEDHRMPAWDVYVSVPGYEVDEERAYPRTDDGPGAAEHDHEDAAGTGSSG